MRFLFSFKNASFLDFNRRISDHTPSSRKDTDLVLLNRPYCRSDNRVVAARGGNLDWHSDATVTPGYIAKFKDGKTPITPTKVRSTHLPSILSDRMHLKR